MRHTKGFNLEGTLVLCPDITLVNDKHTIIPVFTALGEDMCPGQLEYGGYSNDHIWYQDKELYWIAKYIWMPASH